MAARAATTAVILGLILACRMPSGLSGFGTTPTPSDQGVITASSGSVTGGNTPADSPLAAYPDRPLSTVPAAPISVEYLLEHRSALDGATIRVRGIVAAAWPAGPCTRAENCRPPIVFLADTADQTRDRNRDVRVQLLPSEDGRYRVGESAELAVWVRGNGGAVSLFQVAGEPQ